MRHLSVSCLAVLTLAMAPTTARLSPPSEAIDANDNRSSAGALDRGVLTVNLEARRGMWYPDGRDQPGVEINAFGEAGRALQVPGPLLRVTEGTVIRASIRNTLRDSTLVMHGLFKRDQTSHTSTDTIRIAPGTVREVRFEAGRPGTYFYWGTTNLSPDWTRSHGPEDSQLSGAFIVDSRGSAPPTDRVFLLGIWTEYPITELNDASPVVTRFVINGRTWPNTERLAYTIGDSVGWRLINASNAPHPMHLHGFYFRVMSRGTEDVDQQYPASRAPDLAVTERIAPGQTRAISWVPERPGNWLFHCHDNMHIQPSRPFAHTAGGPAAPAHDHARGMMGGLVMGVEVRPRAGEALKSSDPERRKLRLVARADAGNNAAEPAYSFALQGAGLTTQQPTVPGPPIVLTRGQPVSITVVNELTEPTAIHWHGIELESYFDGVAGFAGQNTRLAPLIAPRDSFEARFTPPRAGTFIYHTHVDEIRQQRAGLAGALLVFEPGEGYDPTTDLVLLLNTPRKSADRELVMLNGSTKPAPMELRAGTHYRLRIINMHTYRPSMRIELKQDSTVLSWRALAKDGATIPPERAIPLQASLVIGNGETYDFEFTPTTPGEMILEITKALGGLLLTQPIRVR